MSVGSSGTKESVCKSGFKAVKDFQPMAKALVNKRIQWRMRGE